MSTREYKRDGYTLRTSEPRQGGMRAYDVVLSDGTVIGQVETYVDRRWVNERWCATRMSGRKFWNAWASPSKAAEYLICDVQDKPTWRELLSPNTPVGK